MASPNRISKGPGRVSLGAETVSVPLAVGATSKRFHQPLVFVVGVVLPAPRSTSPTHAAQAAGALAAGVFVRLGCVIRSIIIISIIFVCHLVSLAGGARYQRLFFGYQAYAAAAADWNQEP